MSDFAAQAAQAAADIGAATGRVDPAALEGLVQEIAAARRIVLHGVGRAGLMMRGLAMRLAHLGLHLHMAGDMSAPPVGPGDLLVVSSGPGALSTVGALIGVAKAAGARTACVTAQPDGPDPAACDRVLVIPAQTMADDRGAAASRVLPMGSLFEGAQFLTFELLVLALRNQLGETAETMRATACAIRLSMIKKSITLPPSEERHVGELGATIVPPILLSQALAASSPCISSGVMLKSPPMSHGPPC